MIGSFTLQTFEPHQGDKFRIGLESGQLIEVELAEVTELGKESADQRAAVRRVPFSLVFHGPLQPVLPQQIYSIEHEELGTFELFLVPIGPERGAMRYEAIFT